MNDWKKKAKPKAESANPASISVPTWANFQILKGAAPEAFASTDQVSLNAFKTYLLNQNWVVTDEHHSPAFDLLARRGDELPKVRDQLGQPAGSGNGIWQLSERQVRHCPAIQFRSASQRAELPATIGQAVRSE